MINKKSIFLKDFLLGKFDYKSHDHFVQVDQKWCEKEIFLQQETYQAFFRMAEAAKNDGIDLKIVSGTRNFEEQKTIWERKWNANKVEVKSEMENARKILMYSSMPGTSRHHWGTDIDINSVEEEYFRESKGKKEYQWLVNHASQFGFCQVYSDPTKTKRTGYKEEVWHWSYMPLSHNYLNEYLEKIGEDDLSGFQGCETAKEIKIIQNFVKGIDCSCESLTREI